MIKVPEGQYHQSANEYIGSAATGRAPCDICMCVYMCMCVYVCMCIHMYIYIYIHMFCKMALCQYMSYSGILIMLMFCYVM